jgi:uncharacterized low-complexity protein
MRIGKGARSVERELRNGESKCGSGAEAQRARTANAKCGGKDSPRLPPLDL